MDYKVSKLKLSREEVLQKIKNWCAYQERSQHQARQKLFEYRQNADEVENILAELIADNFINEERFAIAFAGGKFRMKHWGKIKIRLELKQHRLSEYCIKKGLRAIDEKEYEKTIQKLLDKKLSLVKGSDKRKIFYSLSAYLISKGFENELVQENISKLQLEKTDYKE